MSDGKPATPVVPLERPERIQTSWIRLLAPLAVVVCLTAGIVGRCDKLDCAIAKRSAQSPAISSDVPKITVSDAVHACRDEFQRTRDPRTGIDLADLLFLEAASLGHAFEASKEVARQLLLTSEQANALQLLGEIAIQEGKDEHAVQALEAARSAHSAQWSWKEVARDDHLLATIRADRGEFADALRLLDQCIVLAPLVYDMPLLQKCHLSAVRTLVRIGAFTAAQQEVEIAEWQGASDDDRFDLEYQYANIAQETGRHAIAQEKYEELLQRSDLTVSAATNIHLNLAYSLAEQYDFDNARLHLVYAMFLDSRDVKAAERAWVAAQIAYRQKDLAFASSQTERYFELTYAPDNESDQKSDALDLDDRLDVTILRARIELEKKDLSSAELWARRAIKQAEVVRGKQSVLQLRPWVLSKRREAHELLFTVLAESGQVEAAVMAFDAWQGRTVQDALAKSQPPARLDRQGIANQVSRLGRWLSVASQAPIAKGADRGAVLSTMRDIDLLALIVASGDVWRLTANHGSPRLLKIAKLAEIKDQLATFLGHPRDDQPSSALGKHFVPDELFQRTPDVLHVLVDERLKALPVAALRHGATSLIELRPIVRLLRLPETRCAATTPPGHATVLGNPQGTLDGAQTEADRVASWLHTTAKIGSVATADALFAASGDAVVHVAAHGAVRADGASLLLADREVSAAEISARGPMPSLAVVSTCLGARSDEYDLELAGSLAAGFLAAGSQRVVATLRPVNDKGALEVIERFYRHGGVADPARSLAAAQAELVNTRNADWPYFTVFGPDVCPEGAPDHR